MPAIENWKDYLVDDPIIVFDYDTPIFAAASATEKSILKVIHKQSGKEVFKEKNKPIIKNVQVPEGDSYRWVKQDTGERENIRFKNQTEFFGRKKKVIEGWLGDLNKKREIEGKPLFTKEDFEITVDYDVGELSHAIHSLNNRTKSIMDYLGIHKAIYVIGEGENHRHKLPLPIHEDKGSPYGQYKWGRIDTRRPALLADVRKYVVERKKAIIAPEGFEADDVVTSYQWKSYQHSKKTGKHTHIIVTIDKDSMGTSGLVFNPYVDEESRVWKHPYPYLIDGFGSVYMKDGEIKGEGQLWLLTQMLIGDTADLYSPTARLGVKGGDTLAYEVLAPCRTLQEALTAVCNQYKTWFPDGVHFTSWDGSEQHLTWLEWAGNIFKCAYMLKNKNDSLTFEKLLEMGGVNVE